MIKQNVESAMLGSQVAAEILEQNGLLLTTGASYVFDNLAPEMLSYALSKNMVHNLHMLMTKESSLLEKNANVVCMLPTVIDTPANRQNMPDANFEEWLPPAKIAELINMWSLSENKPKKLSMTSWVLVFTLSYLQVSVS